MASEKSVKVWEKYEYVAPILQTELEAAELIALKCFKVLLYKECFTNTMLVRVELSLDSLSNVWV